MHGASVVPPDALVDACDCQGLLLWTEFFSHGAPRQVAETDHSKYDWSADTGLYLDCARDNILRLRSHPSLLIWVGLNEDWLPREPYDPICDMVATLDGAHKFLPGSHQHGDEPDWVHKHSEMYSGGPWIYRSPLQSFQDAADLTKKLWGVPQRGRFPHAAEHQQRRKVYPRLGPTGPGELPAQRHHGIPPGAHAIHQRPHRRVAEIRAARGPRRLPVGLGIPQRGNPSRLLRGARQKHRAHRGRIALEGHPVVTVFHLSVFNWYRRPHAGYYAMIRLHNPTAQPALMLMPSILAGSEGNEILPTFWDDRYLDIAPGETRQFTARWARNQAGTAAPHLMVQGWNAVPVELNLRDGLPVDLRLHARYAGNLPPNELAVADASITLSEGATAYTDGGLAGIDSLGFRLTHGDPATVWSAASPKKWVFLDLGLEQSVHQVTLDWGTHFANRYQLQVSDDAFVWRTVSEKSGGTGGLDATAFPPTLTRYVRFNGIGGPDRQGIVLREMVVR